MSYKDGNEYISPLLFCSFLLDGVDVELFFEVVESPNPFPDAADKGKWLLDAMEVCDTPPIRHEKPSVATMESAVKAPTNIAEFDGDISNRFSSNNRIEAALIFEGRMNNSSRKFLFNLDRMRSKR